MSLFSFFRKKKKNKTLPDVSESEQAEDVLVTDLAEANIKPEKCVALEPSVIWVRQPINATLVKGPAESKPKICSASKTHQPYRISSVKRYSVGDTTRQPEIQNVRYAREPPSIVESLSRVTTNRLYPVLDTDLITKLTDSSSARAKSVEDKDHNIAGEICLEIQPRILNASMIEKNINRVRNDAEKKISAVKNTITNTSKLEYNFDKELNFIRKYPDVENQQKLNSFNDVQRLHRRNNELVQKKISYEKNAVPIFQIYRDRLKSYKGRKSDIIDCD